MVEKMDENKREDKETIKKYIREDREGMIQMVKKIELLDGMEKKIENKLEVLVKKQKIKDDIKRTHFTDMIDRRDK